MFLFSFVFISFFFLFVCFGFVLATVAATRTGRLLVHGSGQDDLLHASVPLAPQTCQVDVRSGHVALAVPLGLGGHGAGQPGLRGVLPPQVAQNGLRRVGFFGLQISLELLKKKKKNAVRCGNSFPFRETPEWLNRPENVPPIGAVFC